MIKQAQIFVIYEPSMYGTFVSNLFLKNKFDLEFTSDKHGFNAHKSAYKDRLKNFHKHTDALNFLKKNNLEKKLFFKTLEQNNYSVHRLASYAFNTIEFDKFFKNYVKIICVPKPDRLGKYAERFAKSTAKKYKTQYWAKNFKKKDLNKVPDYFLIGMTIKERKKYLLEHSKYLKNYKYNQKHDIVFDPDHIIDFGKLQKFVNSVMVKLNLEPVKLPAKQISKFVSKNKKFLPSLYK